MTPRNVFNAVLAMALLATLGLNWGLRQPKVRPNIEYLPDMVRTARYNAFEPNPNFADESTLRPPVPGTIPRGLPPLPEDVTAMVNPYTSGDQAALERGAVVYANFCRPCHADDGLGEGLVVKHGAARPPSLLRPRTLAMSDGQIFQIITNGRVNMAPYGAQVSRDDRWKAILHVRALQKAASPQ
jgi:mono/diheme cytochrome c family protein